MKRCKKCLMADTKPGLVLDDAGVCQACRHYELRKTVNYKKRFKELSKLAARHKGKERTPGKHDCIIAVSGGKDSHFQVHIMKEVLGMNPLLVSVNDPFTKTEAGKHNAYNLRQVFGCDMISLDLNPDLVRRMVRIAFDKLGSPTWPIDRAIYTFPIRMAAKMGIPLIVYGENVGWEYGGVFDQTKETYSAIDQINNDVAKKVSFSLWLKNGVDKSELNMLRYPTNNEIKSAKLDPIYLSYFMPWDGYENYLLAQRYGFRDLKGEWDRDGYIEDYDQIDSVGYLMNVFMKYQKFGFGRATDVVGYWIRSGKITREHGADLIKEHDHKLDPRILADFLQFTGYSEGEFWSIAEKWKKGGR